MPYSLILAERVRHALRNQHGIAEKKMFGGLAFLLHGNMLVGVWQQAMIVRCGPEQAEAALQQDHVRPFDVTGKPMRGWVMIEPDGFESDQQLVEWVAAARRFVELLPQK